MSYTLPYDPFLLLRNAETHSYSADNSQITWKGAGTDYTGILSDDDNESELEIAIDGAPLYVSVNGNPTKLELNTVDPHKCWGYFLRDGLSQSNDCHISDDYAYYYYHETLAIALRNDESDLPIALVDHKYSSSESWDWGNYYSIHDYEPYVVYFKTTTDRNSNRVSTIKEARQEQILESNNQYWEGVFQYDINGDGSIPDYIPNEYPRYSKPDKDLNGKIIKGTNQNDKLKGKKQDDSIKGKKGDDKLSGKKGDDLLAGENGSDQLYGQAGDDFLNGGHGDDLLNGGKGADVFKLSRGIDTITDFNVNEGDRIAIPAEYIDEFVISTVSGDASVEVDGYGTIVIAGLNQQFSGPINAEVFLRYV